MVKDNENIQEKININTAEVYNKSDFRDKKVLYIHPTYGDTYPIINQGIIEQLKNLVREVYTATVEQDVVTLAGNLKPDLVLVLLGDTFSIDQ